MNKLISISLIVCLLLTACVNQPNVLTRSKPTANNELHRLVKADQASRMLGEQDHKDYDRRVRVLELIAAGKLVVPQDKVNAALILQHTGFSLCDGKWASISAENYLLAHNLVKSAIKDGHQGAEYLYAQTIDRYLSLTKGTQKFGTNILFDPDSGEGYYPKIDRKTTDEERAYYGVSPLQKLLSEYPERGPSHGNNLD